uniref:Uncharacterized protein n=1 Tax=Aegilops tauschii subsp. strangulata TaxID=200361 RepID=A0A452ZBZ9_AEGTS
PPLRSLLRPCGRQVVPLLLCPARRGARSLLLGVRRGAFLPGAEPQHRAEQRGSMSTISDQKKRTLEAIQQRYAAAKAKKLQDEQPKCPKNKESTPKPKFDAQRKGKTPESTPRTSGQLPTFRAQGISSHQQKPSASSGGEINPIYSELSFALHENLSQDD